LACRASAYVARKFIAVNDTPKVDGLKQLFPNLYRDQPVLVPES
jgi:peptide-methionine (S)-S-oxide reductase